MEIKDRRLKQCHWWGCKMLIKIDNSHCEPHRLRHNKLIRDRCRRHRLRGLCTYCAGIVYKWGLCRKHFNLTVKRRKDLLAAKIAARRCAQCLKPLPVKRRRLCDACYAGNVVRRSIIWQKNNPARYAELHRRAASAYYYRQRVRDAR